MLKINYLITYKKIGMLLVEVNTMIVNALAANRSFIK